MMLLRLLLREPLPPTDALLALAQSPASSAAVDEDRAVPPQRLPRRLRVAMVPFYHDNPYQRELAEALAEHEVEVTPYPRLKRLISDMKDRAPTPDVVHLHWLPVFRMRPVEMARFFMFLVRIIRLRRAGRQIVWTVHNLYTHEGESRRAERMLTKLIIRCASRLIVHSPSAARLVAAEFEVTDPAKIVALPHGNYINSYPNHVSRAAAREHLGLPAEGPVLLFLGKIRPYKGVTELVRAFRALEHPTATLVIAGSPLNDEIVGEIRAEMGNARVRLEPTYIRSSQVQYYMNAADAVVFPYQDVLTSGAVVLAMSFGRACIAARLGCIQDVLDDEGGVLYDPEDPEALRRALRLALERSQALEDMGQHNLAKAAEWRWSQIARHTLDVYRSA